MSVIICIIRDNINTIFYPSVYILVEEEVAFEDSKGHLFMSFVQ